VTYPLSVVLVLAGVSFLGMAVIWVSLKVV
jgi:hypothetical protein